MHFRRPKKKPRVISGVLSEAEVAVFIAAAENIREKAILSVLACTGIRNQELCNLRVKDLDIPHNLVRIEDGKGGYCTNRNFPPECIEVVMRYLQEFPRSPEDFLFTTLRARDQYKTWDLRRLVRKAAKNARLGKRVYPHRLRHSLATNLLNRGAKIHSVQWQLGHRHTVTTMIYLHSNPAIAHREVQNFQPAYI